ncbi:anti-sigma factor [Pseudomonas sp. GD03842]|uniref:anti-sigma factor n=1 Tax=unclassified Pseudomonas TaxID=196821 RepID=UPI000D386D71|nr:MULTISPECIES: anti-sigma factor [unclassified Pseudomonas]MDH0746454.1 anti-sigma factor [Pseudomonas sp. GD03842]RAU46529.1 RNA polymerase subunit sigma-70 [Pseudomonas sp. RIT 409]RAU52458.1 RNA polymerase subunit sigma-70 [Pseudomonas sp. RIT 412]
MSEKQDKIPDLDVQTLAGEYVLGTLTSDQRAEVQERLVHDPALRKAIDGWRSRLLMLTEMAEPPSPSSRLWNRIERNINGLRPTPQTRRAQRKKRRLAWWDNAGLWRGLAGLGLAASVILTTQLLGHVPTPPAPAFLAVLSTPGDHLPGWVIQASNLRGIQLVPVDQTQVPIGKVLQLWTQADDWQGPISLGLVSPGQTLKVPTDRLPPLQPNQMFELSLEKAGGSPTNKPSGPIQFIGRTVKAG